jgi:hypothetical protein
MQLDDEKLDIIRKAIGTGEVIKIKYHGGSQPGAVREITPNKLDGNKIYAHCLTSNTVKAFIIDKIELTEKDDPVLYDINYIPPTPPTLKEIYDTYKEEWENLGWVVRVGEMFYTEIEPDSEFPCVMSNINYEKFGEGGMDVIELYKKFKNGKVMKIPLCSIHYGEESREEIYYNRAGHTKKYNKVIEKFIDDSMNYFK